MDWTMLSYVNTVISPRFILRIATKISQETEVLNFPKKGGRRQLKKFDMNAKRVDLFTLKAVKVFRC